MGDENESFDDYILLEGISDQEIRISSIENTPKTPLIESTPSKAIADALPISFKTRKLYG